MPDPAVPAITGENFTAAHLGPFAGLHQYAYEMPKLKRQVEGKVFLKELLGLTSAEISFNIMPPGVGMPFYHTHRRNEEIYLFVGGTGEFQVDGKVIPVKEGSVARVARGGERCWRNTGTEPLHFIVIQSREGSFEGHTTEDGVGVAKPVTWDGPRV